MLEDPFYDNDDPKKASDFLATLLAVALGIGLAVMAVTALAEEPKKDGPLIVRKGADFVRLLTDTPCNDLPSFRGGQAMLDGKTYKLCWKLMAEPQLHVRVIFEDGDLWEVAPAAFKLESESML